MSVTSETAQMLVIGLGKGENVVHLSHCNNPLHYETFKQNTHSRTQCCTAQQSWRWIVSWFMGHCASTGCHWMKLCMTQCNLLMYKYCAFSLVICITQWWNVTKYIYSSTVLKCSFEVLVLYFFMPLSTSTPSQEGNIVLLTSHITFESFSYFTN